MNEIIIGNICSIGAMISDSYSSTKKTRKDILLVQCISQIFYAAGSFILKGYSATVQNVVTIFRNTYAVYGKRNRLAEWFFILLPVILGLAFNNRSWLGVLPVVANLQYSLIMMFCRENPIMLKYSLVVVCILFTVFNFAIMNFVSGISCIVTTIVTLIAIIKSKSNKENTPDN